MPRGTGRSHSQSFGLATVRVYHRRAAEPNHYAARLAALEQIRQEYHRWKYGGEPQFQKVFSIHTRHSAASA